MELGGKQRQIQALFCELKLEDGRTVPAFARVWNRAQIQSAHSGHANAPRRSGFSYAVAGVIAVTILFAALVGKYQRGSGGDRIQRADVTQSGGVEEIGRASGNDSIQLAAKQFLDATRGAALNISPARAIKGIKRPVPAPKRFSIGNTRLTALVALSNWQSPTATLMVSPSHDVLTSLPQLSQAATELDAFLNNQGAGQ